MAHNNRSHPSGFGAGANPHGWDGYDFSKVWNDYLNENPPLEEEPELHHPQDSNDDQEHDLNKLWDDLAPSDEPDAQQAVSGNGDGPANPEVLENGADATQTGLSAPKETAENPESAPLAATDGHPVPQDDKTSVSQDDKHSASQDDKSGADEVDGNDDDIGQHSQDVVGDADVEHQRNKSSNPDTSNDIVDKSTIPSLADGNHEGANDDDGSEHNFEHERNDTGDESSSNSSFDSLFDERPEDEHDQSLEDEHDADHASNASGDSSSSNSSYDRIFGKGLEDEYEYDADHEGNEDGGESISDSSFNGFSDNPEDEHNADHEGNESEDDSSSNSSYDRIFGKNLEDENDADHESSASGDESSSNSSSDKIFGQGAEDDNRLIQHGEPNQQTIINVFQSTGFNKKFNKLFDNELSAHFHEVIGGVGTWSEDGERASIRESSTGCDQAIASIEEPAVVPGALDQASNQEPYQIQHMQAATQPATAAYNGDPVPQQIGGVFNSVTHRFSFDIDHLNTQFVLSRILWAIISGSRLIGYANWSAQSFFDIFANSWVHLPSPINLDLNSSERFRPFRIVEKNSIEPRYRNALTLMYDAYAGEMLYKLASSIPYDNPPLPVPPPEDSQNFFDFDRNDQAASFPDPANIVQYPGEGVDFGTMYTGTGVHDFAAEPVTRPVADLAAQPVVYPFSDLPAEPVVQPFSDLPEEPIEQQAAPFLAEPAPQQFAEFTAEPTTQPDVFAQESIHGSTSQSTENVLAAPTAWPTESDRSSLHRPALDSSQESMERIYALLEGHRPSNRYQFPSDRPDATAPSQRARNDWQPNDAPFNAEPSTSNYTFNHSVYERHPMDRPRPSEGMLNAMAFARMTGVRILGSEHYQQEVDDRFARLVRPPRPLMFSQAPEAPDQSLSDCWTVSPSSSGSSSHKRKASNATGADNINDDDNNNEDEDEAAPSPPKRRSPERAPPLTTPARRRRQAEIITRDDGTTYRRNANGSIPIPGAPRGRASAWSEAEDDFAIQFVRMIREGDRTGRVDDLWVQASERMRQMGFNRSADSIKNQWNRRLRAKSGFDERATPRSDAMTTGELGSDAPKVGRVKKGGPRS